MNIIETGNEVRQQVKAWRKEGLSIGFVPTMGYLHEGHKSLIDKAVEENDKVVVSIFVNPMQFGPTEDLESYPRDLSRDAAICEMAGADIIFHPDKDEMYFDDFSSYVDMDTLTNGLCGKTRPIHFRGVCTVVAKLFHIVTPDRAYFGQKDAQQLAVIKHMVRDLNFGIDIVGCPIIREEDGLAKSSRNTYLSVEERQAATILSKALNKGKELVIGKKANADESVIGKKVNADEFVIGKKANIEEVVIGKETNADVIKKTITHIIESEPCAEIDYVEVVDWNTLEPVDQIQGPILVAIAVYIGKTRLIDNFIVE